MAKPNFVHLHVHSHYSLLDGLGKVDDLVNRAVELGMPALALTDHGVLHGAIEFYLACKQAGIKPIIGQEAYVARRKRTDSSPGTDTKPYHLLLLAKSLTGYRNLIKLTTIAHLEGYYYKPRMDREILAKYSEGLIATTACLGSETSKLILDGQVEKAEETIKTYQDIFGKDNYYLELQHHPTIGEQQVVNEHLKRLSAKHKVPLLVTNDVHYVRPEDRDPHDMLVCIQTGKLVSDPDRMIYEGDFSLKNHDDLFEAFKDVPEALENTLKIAEMTDIEIPLDQNLLPKFPLPANETEESLLRKWCEKGLQERYREITPEIRSRLDYELQTVMKTGFPGYFLIVADVVRYARSRGIYVGPGRGSAAGSLIAYVTGITNVDPIRYGLLFERFLDLNRISMPDIDIDFEDVRRGEVIEYLKQKYGDDHVAGIITFGTIMARAAVRDVGRVLGVPYTKVDQLAKLVPPPIQGRHIPLATSIKNSPELKNAYDKDPEDRQVIDAAIKLEGTVRHASQHACAIVLSQEPLDQYVPTQMAQGGDVHQVTQYSMGPIEKIGLLKMDLLGLANLSIMHRATEIIEAVYGDKIDIYNLPYDDKKTFELLGRGETTGVFQLESSGMKRYIKELKPSRFEDIIAMVALYRPGPMQWIQSFINRKNGLEDVKYLHPLAENALRETYGIPVYQEQVMQMSKDMCGFSGSEADTLRKAMGKKIPKLMKEMKVKFIDGASKNGVEKTQADEIFRQLEDFAAYAFNKSHATCYAMIAYQTAYLKAHYPDCFMAALMTSDLDDTDRLSIEITESERLGLTVLPPDVNESFSDFAVVKEKKAIRFGLAAIKNVGRSVAQAIVKERKANGPYQNISDFLSRNAAALNKKVLESLTRCGALDRFEERSKLYAGVEILAKYVGSVGKSRSASQLSIFTEGERTETLPKLDLPTVPEDKSEYLSWEKELLGLYLSDHPLKAFSELLNTYATPIGTVDHEMVGQNVRLGGMIHAIKKINTKSGAVMGFAELEDLSGMLELVLFPNTYQEQIDLWQTDKAVLVEGRLNDRDGSMKLLVERGWVLPGLDPKSLPALTQNGGGRRYSSNASYSNGGNSAPAGAPTEARPLVIELPRTSDKGLVGRLKALLEAHPGSSPVELRVNQNGQTRLLSTKLRVKPNPALATELAELLGTHA